MARKVTNGTDPLNNPGDTDGDGIDDDVEVSNGTDENNHVIQYKAAGYTGYDASKCYYGLLLTCDGDGVTNDPYETSGDTDGDGIDDDNEINNGTDENNPCDPAQAAGYTGYDASNAIWAAADCDGDGVTNGEGS
ncbi:hypothetical protein GQR58_026422 [Nymphon striatum]|nr:hypothetical protein GQR58_026422 [Nymphon striatum]